MTITDNNQPALSERMQRVLMFATDEADGLGHGFVTCQHLLYALCVETNGLAGAVLSRVGIKADVLHEFLAHGAAEHDRLLDANIDFAEECQHALERAVRRAQEWEDEDLDTEHLLYGILSGATSADKVFEALQISSWHVLSELQLTKRIAPVDSAHEQNANHAYRFTIESAWMLSHAASTARRLGSPHVNSVHLLVALLTVESGVQELLCKVFRVTAEDVYRTQKNLPVISATVRLPLSQEMQEILGASIGEAWNRGHMAVTPMHLAAGLAYAPGNAALEILAELGISRADLMEALATAMPPNVAH
jgi:ATP-dependent Clp protease ATP-binding subunit ClpA